MFGQYSMTILMIEAATWYKESLLEITNDTKPYAISVRNSGAESASYTNLLREVLCKFFQTLAIRNSILCQQ